MSKSFIARMAEFAFTTQEKVDMAARIREEQARLRKEEHCYCDTVDPEKCSNRIGNKPCPCPTHERLRGTETALLAGE